MSDDLVKTARRAEGSDLLPKVSFGVMNAEVLILRMADRIEELEAKLTKAVDALNRIQDGSYGKNAAIARATLAQIEAELTEGDSQCRVGRTFDCYPR